MTAQLIIGRYDWVKNRGGRGSNDARRIANFAKSRSSKAMRAAGNIRGVPQVVFKVVARGGCKGPMGLAAQMDYVLGKADQIIDPSKRFDRESRLHSSYSEAMAEKWASRWKDRTENGHTMHMVASFPQGTDPEKIAEIMREACYEILDQGRSRFRYIAAVHTDKGHPHAHIIVDRKNTEGEWFYFARNGEFTYDRFKDAIVEHAATYGVELVNTSKLSRGITSDSDQNPHAAKRGLAGTLIEHGAAPYQNNRRERMSYYVTVETPQGEKTLWGKELQAVMRTSGAVAGDTIRVTHEGKEAVEITTRDGQKVTTHRNSWAVEIEARDMSRAGAAEIAQPSPPTEAEQKSADWKRAQVLDHAAQYRALSVAYESTFPALASGFSAAADLLEEGRELTPNTLSDRSKTMATSAELQAEQDAARAAIDRASDYLSSVRETIPNLEPERRAEVEARYFDAVRDVEELRSGVAAAEYAEPAHGTLYAEDQRQAIAALDRDQLAEAVKGTGLDADELRARAEVNTPSAAVEEHWLEQDAQAIASARGYDMNSGEGRAAAYADLAEVHMNVYAAAEARREQDLDAATAIAQQMHRDEQELRANSGEVTIPVITSDGERLEMTEAQIREAAARDPELRLESPDDEADLVPTDENIAALREYHEQQRRDNEIDYDAAGDPDYLGAQAEAQFSRFDDRDLSETVEDREAMIAEARELAMRENPTVEEQRRLTEIVERVAGPDAAQQLREGKSEALSEVIPDKAERFDVAEGYLKAEQAQGRDRADAIEAVQKDREADELNQQAEQKREGEREIQTARERTRDRDSGHDL